MAGGITIQKRGDFGIDQSVKKYASFRKTIPKIIATNSVNHFKKGFSKGGGQTNDSKSGWAARKTNRGAGRNILVKTSTLQRDIQSLRVDFDAIVIGTSSITSNYAMVHNEGLGHQTKREFIGDSDSLNNKNIKSIENDLDKVFR